MAEWTDSVDSKLLWLFKEEKATIRANVNFVVSVPGRPRKRSKTTESPSMPSASSVNEELVLVEKCWKILDNIKYPSQKAVILMCKTSSVQKMALLTAPVAARVQTADVLYDMCGHSDSNLVKLENVTMKEEDQAALLEGGLAKSVYKHAYMSIYNGKNCNRLIVVC